MEYFQFIKANRHKPWYENGLNMNPNITWDIVLENPDFCYWCNVRLSMNPNIT